MAFGDGHTIPINQVADEMPLACCFAAYARLHELEAKRSGTKPRIMSGTKIIRMLEPLEQVEFDRLVKWWNEFGSEKQERLIFMVAEFAQQVEKACQKI